MTLDLLQEPVLKLLHPCIIAIYDDKAATVELSYCRSTVSYLGRLIEQLNSNKYRNRALNQNWLNNVNDIRILALEMLDSSSNDCRTSITAADNNHWKIDLWLRYKLQLYEALVRAEGKYSLVSSYKALSLTVEYKFVRNVGVVISFNTGRYKRYWLSTAFSTIPEAQKYVDSRAMSELILELQKEEPCEISDNSR